MKQTVLPIQLNISMLFDNLVITQNNKTIVKLLKDETSSQVIYLYGAKTLAKTHLLQAVTHQALNNNQNVIYFDCKNNVDFSLLENMDLICLDNIDDLDKQQQYSLFELYNNIKLKKTRLIVSALIKPQLLGYEFVDIKTRLSLAVVFNLKPYLDEELISILKQKANEQKLKINEDIFNYLLKTFERDLSNLLNILEKIKQVAMERKKLISLSLVKEIIKEINSNENS